MILSKLKVFPLALYENYNEPTTPAQLCKYLEVNLADGWDSNQLKAIRKRQYKPTDFKVLYKHLYKLKQVYPPCKKSNWIKATKTFTKNSVNISETSSYFLRALNNSKIYKKQSFPYYQCIDLKGFTFDKEKIIDKKNLFKNKYSIIIIKKIKIKNSLIAQQNLEKFYTLSRI